MSFFDVHIMSKLNLILKTTRSLSSFIRLLSTTPIARKMHCCKLLVVGGGAGGISTAARFSKLLYKHELIIVEPQDIHCYRPYLTLIGAGDRKLTDAVKPSLQIMPENAVWLKDLVTEFCPETNTVILKGGSIVEYDVMIISVGIKLDIDSIKGLKEALDNYGNVSTIYSPKYVNKVFTSIKEFETGIALFTAPCTPIKCSSASFEICFLAEDYFRKHGKCAEADVTFATAEPSFFPIKVYDDLLWKVAKRKGVDVHVKSNLIEVLPESRKAVFECLAKPGNKINLEYCMLHVTPPMSVPDELKDCRDLVNATNFVNVDIHTLRHKKFPNVFALGDCSPYTSNKTSNISAVGSQSYVVFQNVCNVLQGKEPVARCEGYTASPMATSYGKCIFAEFDTSMTTRETLPFRQDFESKVAYYLKKYVIAHIYWRLMLKGAWNGMERLRKLFHLEFIKIGKKK